MVFLEHVATFPLRKTKNTNHEKHRSLYQPTKTQIPSTHILVVPIYMFCVDHPYCLSFFLKIFFPTIQPFHPGVQVAFKLQLFTCFAKPWVEQSMKQIWYAKWLGDERKKNSLAQICGGGVKGRRPGVVWDVFCCQFFEVIEPLHNILESIQLNNQRPRESSKSLRVSL